MRKVSETDYGVIKSLVLKSRETPYYNRYGFVRNFIETCNAYGIQNESVALLLGISLRSLYRIKTDRYLVSADMINMLYDLLHAIMISENYTSYNGG